MNVGLNLNLFVYVLSVTFSNDAKMNPEKSERKSRRSSILKPSKPRQPFQNVDLVASSAENSPSTTTTKVKRRVSFAEKKHVKEFCDSMEQGTVWDYTYEESELSQMRNSENSNTDENITSDERKLLSTGKSQISVDAKTTISITESICTENNENFRPIEGHIKLRDSLGGFASTGSLSIPFTANHSESCHARRSLSATESAFGRNPNKEQPSLSESSDLHPVIVSATSNATEFEKSANMVLPKMKDDDYNNISMDETLIENLSVTSTLPTPITVPETAPILHTTFNAVADTISSVSSLHQASDTSKNGISPMEVNGCQTIRPEAPGGIVVYQDTSMERTEAMSNRISIISEHQSKILDDKKSNEEPILVTEQKTIFQIETVDTVTKILGLSKRDSTTLDPNEIDLRPERMPIFHNKSVKSRNDARNILSANPLRELPAAKTKIFHNEPIDVTEIVQDVQKSENIESEQTTVFHDTSSDLTEAIRNVPSTCQLQKQPSEKVTIFHDEFVDFTGIDQNLPSIEEPQTMAHEKTTLFANKPLDFTDIVRSSDSDGNLQISSEKSPTETTNLQDQLMDIPEAMQNSSSNKSPEMAVPEKTIIFQSQPVDMTEVVPDYQSYKKQPQEKTMIFHNQSMDMTEVIHNRQSYAKPSPEKTTIFHDQSVDITEVVRSHQIYEKPSPEKKTIFHDSSVKMTGPVQTSPSYDEWVSAKMTQFQNKSVDIIKDVQSNPAVDNSDNHNKRTTIPDKSPDTTKTIPSGCLQKPARKVCDLEFLPSSPQRTTVLDNTSAGHNDVEMVSGNKPSENHDMELTEAIAPIPSSPKLLSRDSCILVEDCISKQKPLGSKEANEFIACIDVKSPDCDLRSPVRKRMKPLGNRQSLDLTAAVPFVMYRKLARQRHGDIKSTTCNSASAQVHCGTFTTEDPSKIAIDVKEVPAVSTDVESFGKSPARPLEGVTQEARHETTNFQIRPMEMTEAIPCHYFSKSTSQVCTDSTDDADWQRQQANVICHDDSMEITRAIPGILKVNAATYHDNSMEFTKPVSHHPITENFPAPNGNHGSVINQCFDPLPTFESRTMVFHDQSMELTSGIHISHQPIEKCRPNIEESKNRRPDVIAEVKRDEKTMVYRDDSMELTRAVQFPLQVRGQDKENCSPGTEYLKSRSSRRSEKESSVGISNNEWLEIMKSVSFKSSQEHDENIVGNARSEKQSRDTQSEEITGVTPFLSSQENKENEVEPIESEKQRLHTESDNITGVVSFATSFETKKGDECTLKEGRNAIGFGVGEMEITENYQRPVSLHVEKPVNVFDEVDRHSGLPSQEVFPLPVRTKQRHSQVAKVLFKKPVPIDRSKETNENMSVTSGTANFDAEIRKLAETFALSNSVDESGFDQATFLRQQARCMEDYEANSTASQELDSGTFSTKNNMSNMGKKDSPDSKRSISPMHTDINEKLTLPTENREISPDSKTANISVCKNNNSQCDGSVKMNREDYDRSLEELRCRAYSVSKFRPEVTGFELTGAISLMDPGNLHKSIFDEEPPSYVFSDSVTTDAITDCSALLSTGSDAPIGGKERQDRMSLETSHVSIPDITECVNPLRNDNPEKEFIGVTEETITLEGYHNDSGVLENENVERVKRSERSQTFVIKRPSIDPTTFIASSTETDAELQRERLSGVTTAAEFSSVSPDGPNEKIRRRESESTIEEGTLPIVDKVANEPELIENSRASGKKTLANNTAVGADYSRQFVCQEIDETSIVLGRPSSSQLPFEIIHDDDQMVKEESKVEKAIEIEMELEDVTKSPYTLLKETIESLAGRPDTIWKIKSLDEQIVAFTFFSRSLVVAIYLKDNAIWNSTDPIEVIGFLSQLKEDGSSLNTRLAHGMIMKKISSASLTDSYKSYEDIPRMLEYVTAEVKLAMDFMFELDRLRDRMIMDINGNRITFVVRTRDVNAGIILNITMEIKPFEEISPDDITIACLLGREKISEYDIKRLITNVKRDHRFLRFYINDVRSYIEIIAESGFSMKKRKEITT